MTLAPAVHKAPENTVGQRVAAGAHIVAAINKRGGILRRPHGVEHHRHVAAGGIFHPHGNVHPAGGEPVLLVFHRARADGLIGQNIVQIAPVFRVKHLVRRRQGAFAHGPDVHFPNGDNAPVEIRRLGRIRLVQHPLVACAGRAGLVRINARNQNQPIRHLLADLRQAAHVLANRILVVRGARTDNYKKLVRLPGKHLFNLRIPRLLHRHQGGRDRILHL